MAGLLSYAVSPTNGAAVSGKGAPFNKFPKGFTWVPCRVFLRIRAPLLKGCRNCGVWVDEFEAMDLLDCLDTTWSGAVVYIDDKTKKDLDRPYGRVNRKLLKSKMLQKCISNGVRFHHAKIIKVVHEDSKSLLICNDGVTVQATVVLDVLFSMINRIIRVIRSLTGFWPRLRNTLLM